MFDEHVYIDEVILVLKKEINKTQAKEYEKGGEYRQMLIQAVHQCAVKFPDVASNVVHLLMDFLGDSNVASAMDVIIFVREVLSLSSLSLFFFLPFLFLFYSFSLLLFLINFSFLSCYFVIIMVNVGLMIVL